ncbi:MAG: conjugal transfer protein TraX [Lachnospiraceae bacterium]|nr:conjugal transfer protein TraX [Lachnospiraceae bacterium]
MKDKKGVSGSTLKMVAVITMLIDHIAAVVLYRYLIANHFSFVIDLPVTTSAEKRLYHIYLIYDIMRGIGRIAFPIYCFLLVEGFIHTRSRARYAFRLFLFALLSEIPFDLDFRRHAIEFSYQNVFFTLLIGFLTIWVINAIVSYMQKHVKGILFQILRTLCFLFVTAIGAVGAKLLKTDYAAAGVIAISCIFFFKQLSDVLSLAAGCVALTIAMPNEWPAFFGLLLVEKYNGTRGWKWKYIFYFFYPVHLWVLYGICVCMGI